MGEAGGQTPDTRCMVAVGMATEGSTGAMGVWPGLGYRCGWIREGFLEEVILSCTEGRQVAMGQGKWREEGGERRHREKAYIS